MKSRSASSLLALVAITGFVADFVAFGGDRTAFPDKPWSPPQLQKYEADLAHAGFGETEKREGALMEIDPDKVYGLPELVDMAERTNPETRILHNPANTPSLLA